MESHVSFIGSNLRHDIELLTSLRLISMIRPTIFLAEFQNARRQRCRRTSDRLFSPTVSQELSGVAITKTHSVGGIAICSVSIILSSHSKGLAADKGETFDARITQTSSATNGSLLSAGADGDIAAGGDVTGGDAAEDDFGEAATAAADAGFGGGVSGMML